MATPRAVPRPCTSATRGPRVECRDGPGSAAKHLVRSRPSWILPGSDAGGDGRGLGADLGQPVPPETWVLTIKTFRIRLSSTGNKNVLQGGDGDGQDRYSRGRGG